MYNICHFFVLLLIRVQLISRQSLVRDGWWNVNTHVIAGVLHILLVEVNCAVTNEVLSIIELFYSVLWICTSFGRGETWLASAVRIAPLPQAATHRVARVHLVVTFGFGLSAIEVRDSRWGRSRILALNARLQLHLLDWWFVVHLLLLSRLVLINLNCKFF